MRDRLESFAEIVKAHFAAVDADPKYYTKRDMDTWRHMLGRWKHANGSLTSRSERIRRLAQKNELSIEEARERYTELRSNFCFHAYYSLLH